MNARNLENLYISMMLCTSFLEYLVIFRVFLEDCGHDVSEYSINKIVVETIKTLSKCLGIDEVNFKTKDGDNVFEDVYYISTLKYDDSIHYIPISDHVKLAIGEPIFDLSDVSEENEFMTSIKLIEASDGHTAKLSDLKDIKPSDGGLSEMETFLSFIDLSLYNEILDKASGDHRDVLIGHHRLDEDGELVEASTTSDVVLIIHLMIKTFLKGDN